MTRSATVGLVRESTPPGFVARGGATPVRPLGPDARSPSRVRVAAGGLLSGVLLYAAQPGRGAGPVAAVALVPLLWTARTGRRGLLAGAVCGAVYFGLLLRWVVPFAWFGWAALVAVLSVQYILFGLVAGMLRGREAPWWTCFLVLPSVFVVLEWTRGQWPLGGFPWGDLGASQYAIAFTRAAAASGGVALVSWLLVAANVGVAGLRSGTDRSRATVTLGAVLAVFVGGWWARPAAAPTGRLDVGIVQANRFSRGVSTGRVSREHLAVSGRLPDGLDLAVWGESSLNDTDLSRDTLRDVLGATGAGAVIANTRLPGSSAHRFRNTNLLVERPGEVTARYVNRMLVPFGERVPWRQALGFVRELDAVPLDAEAGTRPGLFRVGRARLGTLICFESTFSAPTRELVTKGAEGIVLTTNNSSFGFSDASAQHVAYTAMRAAETHRAIALAAISGRSALIDASGAVLRETGLRRSATMTWAMPLQGDRTWHVRLGDWVVWVSALLVLAGVLKVSRPRSVRAPKTLVWFAVSRGTPRGGVL